MVITVVACEVETAILADRVPSDTSTVQDPFVAVASESKKVPPMGVLVVLTEPIVSNGVQSVAVPVSVVAVKVELGLFSARLIVAELSEGLWSKNTVGGAAVKLALVLVM
jgi:hypothetical protein